MLLDKVSSLSRQRIMRAVLRIEADLTVEIPLEELAASVEMSPGHFHRVFVELVGQTPAAYLRRLRLERAAISLMITNAAAVDQASLVGYDSREGFMRAFRRHFRWTPEKFRQRAQHQLCRRLARSRRCGFTADQVQITDQPPRRCAFLRSYDSFLSVAAVSWRMLQLAARLAPSAGAELFGLVYDDDFITSRRHRRYDVCLTIPPDYEPPPPFA
ncbi:MAG: AraC family transcriptional regulator, partial [Gemmataceae bacterium]|nr:AraC family transcriptional regulator [Gemmataceae bacterium]